MVVWSEQKSPVFSYNKNKTVYIISFIFPSNVFQPKTFESQPFYFQGGTLLKPRWRCFAGDLFLQIVSLRDPGAIVYEMPFMQLDREPSVASVTSEISHPTAGAITDTKMPTPGSVALHQPDNRDTKIADCPRGSYIAYTGGHALSVIRHMSERETHYEMMALADTTRRFDKRFKVHEQDRAPSPILEFENVLV